MKNLGPAVVVAALLSRLALAQPAPEPDPSPSPAPSPSPVETSTPVATPPPEATPTPELSPTPEATPPVVTVEHNYRMGGAHRRGIRPLRGLTAASGHVFVGDGWNRDSKLPGEDPPKSLDYAGGGLRLGAIYELNPSIAIGAIAGGHQGTHELEEAAGAASPVNVSYSLYYLGACARWQTVPGPAGFYVEAGGGFGAGRRVVTRPNDEDDEGEDELTPAIMGYGALGLTGNVAQGVDVFFEARYMTAPDAADSFTSDDDLDLGGVTGSIGILVRL